MENNFNKIGLPHVYIALFRCLWVPGGGLESFKRVLRSEGWLPLNKGEANRQNVKLAQMALKHLQVIGCC